MNVPSQRFPSEPTSLQDRWLQALPPREDAVPSQQDARAGSLPLTAWATSAGYSDQQQMQALASTLQLPFYDSIEQFPADEEFLARFEIAFARQHQVLGLASDNGVVRVALCDWQGWTRLDVIARVMRRPAQPIISTASSVQAAINAAYQKQSGQAQQLIDSLDHETVLSEIRELDRREDLLDTAGRAPVIKLVNLILFEAVKSRASDVHIQPYDDRVVVRQRIDGVLFDSFEIPKSLQEEVLTRIKVLGRMDIAEKRLPQDGRATVQVGDRVIDLRIASLPTSFNERIVIRLLDKSARLYTLGELGMGSETLSRFRELIQRDHGLILVTGPTGSGKSTTLYAALQEINTTDQNVLTLEDPIEYQLNGISQTQINEKKGMTFASGLRSVLRQDPDIIMVGEIRDHETAVMSIQASLTGHLVFSTLHTNDAASAVTRLLDLGIEPYLVASSLIASLAQRLVRRLCPSCKTIDAPDGEDELGAQALDPSSPAVIVQCYRAVGCPECRQTGFHGRVGLFEMLVMDDECRNIVQARGNAAQVRDTGLKAGMRLLKHDGLAKVRMGLTTIHEVVRVARLDGADEPE